jgi:hypothetical protein
MPPKPVSKTKAKSKVKKMLRKAENAVMIEKMNTLRRALFDDAGAERWVVFLVPRRLVSRDLRAKQKNNNT